MTDEWSEDKTKNKLKSVLIAAVTYEGGPVSIIAIMSQCEKIIGAAPNVGRFGYKNLLDFLRQHSDVFREQGNLWTYNPACITESDRNVIRDIEQSDFKGKKSRGRGRGGAIRGGGGGAIRGGGGGYGSAFKPTFSNNAHKPGFSNSAIKESTSSFSESFQSSNGFDLPFNDSLSFFDRPTSNRQSNFSTNNGSYNDYSDKSKFGREHFNNYPQDDDYNRNGRDEYDNNDEWNEPRRRDYSPLDSYQQKRYRDDYDQPHIFRSGPSNYSDNFNNEDQYDHYESGNYVYSSRSNEGFDDRPKTRAIPPPFRSPDEEFVRPQITPPPGISYNHNSDNVGNYNRSPVNNANGMPSPPPGFTPPPGFDAPQANGFNPHEQRAQSIMSEGSVSTPKERNSIGDIAWATVDVLSRMWPASMELHEIRNHVPNVFTSSNYSEESVENALKKILHRFEHKRDLMNVVLVERKDDKIYLLYNVALDNLPDGTNDLVFKVATNYLKKNGIQEIGALAKALGIESKGGVIAASKLYSILMCPKAKGVLKFSNIFQKKTVELVKNVVIEPWHPKLAEQETPDQVILPDELATVPEPMDDESRTLPVNNRESPDDIMSLLMAARQKAATNVERYFEAGHSPFLYSIERDGLAKATNKVFMAKVTGFADLNNFWIRTETDNSVYAQLTEELESYYKSLSLLSQPKTLKEGEMVAAYRNNGNTWWFVRGIVLERMRKFILLKNLDEGGTLRIRTEDIYPLSNYFTKLPPLATRCTIGSFRKLTDTEERDLVEEETEIGNILLGTHISFKIRNFEKEEHLIVDLEVPWGKGIKYIPKDYASIMEC